MTFDVTIRAHGETGETIRVNGPNMVSAYVEWFKVLCAARLTPGEAATLTLTRVVDEVPA